MTLFKWNIFGSANTCDWFSASIALLGEQFAKTFRTIRMLVSWSKSLTSQRLITVCTRETFPMKRLIFVCDAALWNHFRAKSTLGGKILLVARYTINFAILGYETLAADRCRTRRTQETILVELLSFVFHFLHSWFKYLCAFITSGSKRLIVAFAAIEWIILGSKRLVN